MNNKEKLLIIRVLKSRIDSLERFIHRIKDETRLYKHLDEYRDCKILLDKLENKGD